MGKSVVLFAIVLTIVLSSCVSSTNNGGIDDPISSGIEAPLIPDADNVSWTSEGGAYKQSYIDVPDDYISLFAHGSDVYFITKNFSEFETANYEIWQNYTDNIYTIEDGSIHCADISDEGIWLVESIVENESIIERLSLLSFTGDVIRTIQTRDIGIVNNSISAVLSVTDYLYIKTTDRIIVINDSGELVASHKLSALKSGLIAGNDGNAYAVQYYDDEVEVYLIQGMNISHSFTLQYPEIKLFTGNEEFCFIMSNSEGLFGVQADGSKSTIVIWKDCGLSMLGLIRVFALPNGEYYCWDIGGLSKLSPVDPSELGKRTELVLATVGQYYGILSTVSNFNQENNKYSVTIKDYSQGGTYDTNTAIMRLNTELSSGKHPDLILFSELSPYAYINNEYLLDLYQCIDNDPEITREDISILDKLEISGGVYFLSNTFNIETLVGLHSEFGDRTGWTLDEYLEFEKNSTTDREILYNNTKAKFLRQLSARYLRTAVDWEAGKCDFNNEMFIAILEASGRIKETP